MRAHWVAFLLMFVLAGCGGGGFGTTTSTSKTTPVVTINSISLTPTSTGVNIGQAVQLHATASYSDGTTGDVTNSVSWSSNAPKVATVGTPSTGNAGVVTGQSAGTVTITATDPTSGAQAAINITVTASSSTLQSIAITPKVTQIAINTQMQLTATGTFASGPANITPNVTWSSSNNGFITVNQAGVIQAVAVGSATISATDPTTGIVGTLTLTVSQAKLQTMAVTPANPSVKAGTTLQMAAIGTFSDGTTQDYTLFVTWSTGNTAVVNVTSTGLASAVSSGNVPVTATDPNTGINGFTTVTVP